MNFLKSGILITAAFLGITSVIALWASYSSFAPKTLSVVIKGWKKESEALSNKIYNKFKDLNDQDLNKLWKNLVILSSLENKGTEDNSSSKDKVIDDKTKITQEINSLKEKIKKDPALKNKIQKFKYDIQRNNELMQKMEDQSETLFKKSGELLKKSDEIEKKIDAKLSISKNNSNKAVEKKELEDEIKKIWKTSFTTVENQNIDNAPLEKVLKNTKFKNVKEEFKDWWNLQIEAKKAIFLSDSLRDSIFHKLETKHRLGKIIEELNL